MRLQIAKCFDLWIKNTFKEKEEIRNFLLDHESKTLAVDEVCSQMSNLSFNRIALGNDYLNKIISAGAHAFCIMAINRKERELLNEKVEEEVDPSQISDNFRETVFDTDSKEDMKRLNKEQALKIAVPNKEFQDGKEESQEEN